MFLSYFSINPTLIFLERNMKNLALVALVAVLAAPAAWAQTGPSGAHFSTAEPQCTVDQNLNVNCTGATIGGVGNTNATANLSATYTATVQCQNKGGQIVDVKTQTTDASSSGKLSASKNGQIVIPPLGAVAPTNQDFLNAATCPNGNWTKMLLPGTPALANFVYTITFAGFTQPFFSLTGP
jgi:hypothetical protein